MYKSIAHPTPPLVVLLHQIGAKQGLFKKAMVLKSGH
jgi:hypothetical protein